MLVSRTGRHTHRVLVRFDEDGKLFMPGEQVAYSGCADWRFEPNDPQEAQRWRVSHANPVRVDEFNAREAVTYPENNQ
jgi:hypothetical protein